MQEGEGGRSCDVTELPEDADVKATLKKFWRKYRKPNGAWFLEKKDVNHFFQDETFTPEELEETYKKIMSEYNVDKDSTLSWPEFLVAFNKMVSNNERYTHPFNDKDMTTREDRIAYDIYKRLVKETTFEGCDDLRAFIQLYGDDTTEWVAGDAQNSACKGCADSAERDKINGRDRRIMQKMKEVAAKADCEGVFRMITDEDLTEDGGLRMVSAFEQRFKQGNFTPGKYNDNFDGKNGWYYNLVKYSDCSEKQRECPDVPIPRLMFRDKKGRGDMRFPKFCHGKGGITDDPDGSDDLKGFFPDGNCPAKEFLEANNSAEQLKKFTQEGCKVPWIGGVSGSILEQVAFVIKKLDGGNVTLPSNKTLGINQVFTEELLLRLMAIPPLSGHHSLGEAFTTTKKFLTVLVEKGGGRFEFVKNMKLYRVPAPLDLDKGFGGDGKGEDAFLGGLEGAVDSIVVKRLSAGGFDSSGERQEIVPSDPHIVSSDLDKMIEVIRLARQTISDRESPDYETLVAVDVGATPVVIDTDGLYDSINGSKADNADKAKLVAEKTGITGDNVEAFLGLVTDFDALRRHILEELSRWQEKGGWRFKDTIQEGKEMMLTRFEEALDFSDEERDARGATQNILPRLTNLKGDGRFDPARKDYDKDTRTFIDRVFFDTLLANRWSGDISRNDIETAIGLVQDAAHAMATKDAPWGRIGPGKQWDVTVFLLQLMATVSDTSIVEEELQKSVQANDNGFLVALMSSFAKLLNKYTVSFLSLSAVVKLKAATWNETVLVVASNTTTSDGKWQWQITDPPENITAEQTKEVIEQLDCHWLSRRFRSSARNQIGQGASSFLEVSRAQEGNDTAVDEVDCLQAGGVFEAALLLSKLKDALDSALERGANKLESLGPRSIILTNWRKVWPKNIVRILQIIVFL